MKFIDLTRQRERLAEPLDAAISRVLAHGHFVMGAEVEDLEAVLSERAGTAHCITCSSGTDALLMTLMAWDVGPGTKVFVPSFTFAATAEVVALLGATPVFVDVDEASYNMSPDSLAAAAEDLDGPGILIGVDMFGLPADWEALNKIAAAAGLRVIADAAQSFGGMGASGPVGSLAEVSTTSFFPAKPLGCYGDGGAIFTDDAELADTLRSIRVHGQGEDKYDNVRVGLNGRLDTLQAAVLLVKESVFDSELKARERVATRYSSLLKDLVTVPKVPEGVRSAWAQYTIATEKRDQIQRRLGAAEIPSVVYYPRGLHAQPAYATYPISPSGLKVTEKVALRVLSLPMHPYLTQDEQDEVVAAVREAVI